MISPNKSVFAWTLRGEVVAEKGIIGNHSRGSFFVPKNVHPNSATAELKKDEKHGHLWEHVGICPHFQIIDICAEFCGFDLEEMQKDENFCGNSVANDFDLVHMIGCNGPQTACLKVATEFQRQLRQCAVTRPVDSVLDKVALMKEPERSRILRDLDDSRDAKKHIVRYRQVIVGLLGNEAKSWSDGLVVSYAQNFLNGLAEATLGDIYHWHGEFACVQGPNRHEDVRIRS